NTGQAVIQGGTVGNLVDNRGDILLAGQSSINQLDSSGVVLVDDAARLTIGDRLDVREGGQMFVDEGARVSGRLVNHGELRSDGRLSGTFRNTGTAVLSNRAETVRNQGVMFVD